MAASESMIPNPAYITRLVVTGLNKDGKSAVVEDGPSKANMAIWHEDFVLNELWKTTLPADNSAVGEPCTLPIEQQPGPLGNSLRIAHIPPDVRYLAAAGPHAGFAAMGESGTSAAAGYAEASHPLMHRTDTVDYIIILSGEIYAVLETGDVLLKAGDVLIQRGTNHAWSNRSEKSCVAACILNGAKGGG